MFDQRGAGRSRPFGSTRANTTWHLVDDITRLLDRFGIDKAVLYGGSCKPSNAAELLALPDVDGALVGGASLDPGDFAAIVEAATP